VPEDVTTLLGQWGEGSREALDRLIPLVYDELRQLAHRQLAREDTGRTIATTALVHEAYVRLVDQRRARVGSRGHFLGLAAKMMRRILVDEARKRGTAKRGSEAPLPLDDAPEPGIAPDENLVALDDALTRLEAFDPGLSRLVELRYFAGLTIEQTADALEISRSTAVRDWQTARAWLYGALSERQNRSGG
jgi:RNA polymerase sigma-70 factor (ECF subfamily)